jgi:hypothetical protein
VDRAKRLLAKTFLVGAIELVSFGIKDESSSVACFDIAAPALRQFILVRESSSAYVLDSTGRSVSWSGRCFTPLNFWNCSGWSEVRASGGGGTCYGGT